LLISFVTEKYDILATTKRGTCRKALHRIQKDDEVGVKQQLKGKEPCLQKKRKKT